MKFRKRPVVVEATRWFKNGDHPEDDPKRCQGNRFPLDDDLAVPGGREGAVVRRFRDPDGERTGELLHTLIGGGCGETWHNHGWIDTLEGGHIVCPGDWIITGVANEHYPCKDVIFKATYEAVQIESTKEAGVAGGAT